MILVLIGIIVAENEEMIMGWQERIGVEASGQDGDQRIKIWLLYRKTAISFVLHRYLFLQS
jgi:hypothetical protein